MRDFFKSVFANLVAFGVIGVLFIIFGFTLIGMIAALVEEKPTYVQANSVLVVDLNRVINDSPQSASAFGLIAELAEKQPMRNLHLRGMVQSILHARGDDRISGILLTGSPIRSGYGSSLAALHEIRGALQAFSHTGKPVVAYIENPSVDDYFLASVATKVYMNPFGIFDLSGYTARSIFLADAFDRYGIGIQTSQAGEFKSIGDIFTRTSMSDMDKLQFTRMLENKWDFVAEAIADSRGLSADRVREIRDMEGYLSVQTAVAVGLVDEAGYLDEVRDHLLTFSAVDGHYSTFAQIDIDTYFVEFVHNESKRWNDNGVAVIYLEGDIVGGYGSFDQAGADRIGGYIREARNDDNIDAVVVRINSPGGSAYASEVISRELALTRQVKPVIASFGGLAASGGYWIASEASYIVSDETTITGSIGVFGLYPNIEELAGNIGVQFDGVSLGQYADVGTIVRPKSDEELKKLHQFTDFYYDRFLGKVEAARGFSREETTAIAEGRIWSGTHAKSERLIDEIGGLGEAIWYAANEAGIATSSYRVVEYPAYSTPAEQFIEMLTGGDSDRVFEPAIQSSWRHQLERDFPIIRSLKDPNHAYARLPFLLVP